MSFSTPFSETKDEKWGIIWNHSCSLGHLKVSELAENFSHIVKGAVCNNLHVLIFFVDNV